MAVGKRKTSDRATSTQFPLVEFLFNFFVLAIWFVHFQVFLFIFEIDRIVK